MCVRALHMCVHFLSSWLSSSQTFNLYYRFGTFGLCENFGCYFCLSMAGCQRVWEQFAVSQTHTVGEGITYVPIFTEDDDGICQYNEILICIQSCVTQTIACWMGAIELFRKKGQLTQFLRAHSWDDWERERERWKLTVIYADDIFPNDLRV